jgi:hypothetical protein
MQQLLLQFNHGMTSADNAAHATQLPLQAIDSTAARVTHCAMRSCKPSSCLQAGLAAASALLLALLLAVAAAPGAEAGRRCASGLLCPDDGWFCCAPGRESCCKNIGTGGPFGRRLK